MSTYRQTDIFAIQCITHKCRPITDQTFTVGSTSFKPDTFLTFCLLLEFMKWGP